ncbi:hypothetical protein LTR50_003423 [Elasticomyces elasticus]|nr:hypothetical protein LTR50_003423 [Elasticomyces elasticus]
MKLMNELDVVVALLLACLNLLPGPTDATLALVVFVFSMSLGSIFVTKSMVSSLWPYPPGWTLGKVVAFGYVAKENDGFEKSTLPVTVSSTRQFDNNNEVEKSTSSSNKPPSEQSKENDGDEKSTFPVTASSTRQFDNNNGVEKSTSSSNKPSPEQSDENDEVERSTLPETTPLPLPPPNSPLSPTTLALIPAASGMSSVAEEPTNYGVVNDAEFDRACTILSSGITDFALGAPAVEENVAAVWSVVQSILKVLQSNALNANDPWADFMLGFVLRAIETVHGRWQATLEPGYSHQWRMSLTQATTSVEDLTALTVRLESMPELNAWLAPLYHAARNLRLDLEKALGHDSAPYPHVPPETTGESMAWEPTNAAMALEPTNAVVAWESADDEMAWESAAVEMPWESAAEEMAWEPTAGETIQEPTDDAMAWESTVDGVMAETSSCVRANSPTSESSWSEAVDTEGAMECEEYDLEECSRLLGRLSLQGTDDTTSRPAPEVDHAMAQAEDDAPSGPASGVEPATQHLSDGDVAMPNADVTPHEGTGGCQPAKAPAQAQAAPRPQLVLPKMASAAPRPQLVLPKMPSTAQLQGSFGGLQAPKAPVDPKPPVTPASGAEPAKPRLTLPKMPNTSGLTAVPSATPGSMPSNPPRAGPTPFMMAPQAAGPSGVTAITPVAQLGAQPQIPGLGGILPGTSTATLPSAASEQPIAPVTKKKKKPVNIFNEKHSHSGQLPKPK